MRHRLDRIVLSAAWLAAILFPAWSWAAGPEVLTPRPGPAPRINGAKVFGVRPGSPFLFTIPATGERPLRYEAQGLPAGLRLDPATGQITGRLDRPGKHDVVFEVSNPHGTAHRPFRIACGETLALTPHMGWNGWYVWENNVTDGNIREAADAMARSGMIDHGYMYVNIDDCWAVKPGAPDAETGGRPATRRGTSGPTAASRT
jgi:alpha-galactosidase